MERRGWGGKGILVDKRIMDQQDLKNKLFEAQKTIQTLEAELHSTHHELQKTNSELLQLTLELEGRVAESTDELKKSNEELQHTTEQLRKIMGGTIEAIAATVEMKDPYTAGHQRRVANVARAIATEMGLSKDKIEGIRVAGTLHDLGKISVPGDILSSPGKLSEIEFDLIKSHPEVGYNILKTIDFGWPVAQIVLQHHEKMDGSGYPKGISGEEILLEARILAVADITEAMSSHRPYRPALAIDEALTELTQKNGTVYDPNVVEAFSSLLNNNSLDFELLSSEVSVDQKNS